MPARALTAASFLGGIRADGLTPDPRLRLLAGEVAPVGPTADGPTALGRCYEQALGGDHRSSSGVWYTPEWLASRLVSTAIPHVLAGTVVDPSCGCGVFLLAAADRLHSLGRSPADAIGQLWGCDVDEDAVAVAEAALWWWSARAGDPAVAGGRLVVGDALVDVAVPTADAVVGNPPFLSPLKRRTAIDGARRTRLRDRFGPAVRANTDPAWLFLLLAAEVLLPGGRAVLVQPQSLLAARDAGPVRAAVEARADLDDMWIGERGTFDAAVSVCAPTLRARPGPRRPADWVGPLADAIGVPPVPVVDGPTLSSVASVHAGFRDEFYGLVAGVTEGGGGRRLVTVGAIDPFGRVDGVGTRFAGTRWQDPRVDTDLLTGRAATWAAVQAAPKVLVATQTRVIEAVADPGGELLGSVPVLAVVPEPSRLWHVLAAVHAPVSTAWLFRCSAGTALATDACKPSAATLADLPLPVDAEAWDEAAELARGLSHGEGSIERFGVVADRAFGVDSDEIRRWWGARLPRRSVQTLVKNSWNSTRPSGAIDRTIDAVGRSMP